MNPANHILVVDDDEDLRLATVLALRKAGHRVDEGTTGQEALDMVTGLHPDLVILDVNLPDIDGTEICRRIKSDPELAETLVIMLSSVRIATDDQIDGLDAGADGYLTRPIPNRELSAKIESYLRLRRAESARLDAERSYRQIFNASPLPIIIHDSETGTIVDVNHRMCEVFGVTRDEATNTNIGEFSEGTGSFTGERALELIHQAAGGDPLTFDWRLRRHDGEPMWCEVLLSSAEVAGQPRVLAFIRDLTERHEAEAQRRKLEGRMLEAQRMESLALMAGGIAHDFNNLLAGIMGNASLALMDLPPESPAREYIEEIETGSIRAADLARQMLAYSGKGRFVVVPTDLNEIVDEMGQLLQSTLSKKIGLNPMLALDLPPVMADATQIRQVVMNLITNAAEAIGDRPGTITLTTGTMDCTDEYLRQLVDDVDLTPGEYVFLEVADTGCGMSEAVRRQVFDPFFSTKFTGRGLGLAAVQGIVRGHDGAVKISSEVGTGTTFKVLFPSIRGAGAAPDTAIDTPLFRGGDTALLVDDEEAVRRVGRRMLERLGFDVLVASNGEEGVEIYREHRDEIRVILLDLMMPLMNGEETFRALREVDPEVPVVMCSGYNSQNISQRFAGRGFSGFLQKPYTLKNLSQTLSDVLGRADSPPGDSGSAT